MRRPSTATDSRVFQLCFCVLLCVFRLASAVTSTCGAFDTDGEDGSWSTAISIRTDHPEWVYDGTAWLNSTTVPLQQCRGALCNNLYSPYDTVFVKKIRLTMGTAGGTGRCHEFTLRSADKGRYTLKELMTLQGGLTARWDDPAIDNAGQVDRLRSTSSQLFEFSSGASAWQDFYYCSELGLNFPNYERGRVEDSWTGRVRLGVTLDNVFPCVERRSVEGIGLEEGFTNRLNSLMAAGRMDNTANLYVFANATVDVFGLSTTRVSTERVYNEIQQGSYGTFDVQFYNLAPGPVISSDLRFTYTFMTRLQRLDVTSFLFRHSDHINFPVTALQYPQWYIRRFYTYFTEDVNGDGSVYSYTASWIFHEIPSGRWTQVALAFEDGLLTTLVDGYATYTEYFSNLRTWSDLQYTVFGSIYYWTPNPAVTMADMRYYSDQYLSVDELNAMRLPFITSYMACGDGYRSPVEACDDGNRISGDGCSSSCQLEAGAVCYGANTTANLPDTCYNGTYLVNLDFEDGSGYNDGVTYDRYYDTGNMSTIFMALNTAGAGSGVSMASYTDSCGALGTFMGPKVTGRTSYSTMATMNAARQSTLTNLPPHDWVEVTGELVFSGSFWNWHVGYVLDQAVHPNVNIPYSRPTPPCCTSSCAPRTTLAPASPRRACSEGARRTW
jgi:cysteine-rich repeat protein